MTDLYNEDTDEIRREMIDDGDDFVTYFCRLTFGQFFTLIVLMVITLGLSFYLGARFGNQYLRLDGSPTNEIASAPILEAPKRVERVERVERAELPAEVEADEALKALARDALRRREQSRLEAKVEDYLAGEAIPSATAPLEAAASMAPEPASVPEPVEAPAAVMATRDTMAPIAQAPETLTALGASGGFPYAIQVGAYRELDEARLRHEEWKAKGYSAYVMQTDIPDRGRWYRVRLGAFATRDEADGFLQQLRQREGVEAMVVENQ